MSKLHEKPVIHGRDHLPGGPDPIPALPEGGTYSDWVAELPGTWAYWPLQETSGDAIDQGPLHANCDPVGTPAYRVAGPNTDDLPFAVRFNGSPQTSITDDSFWNNPDELAMHTHETLSALCWIKPGSGATSTWRLPVIGTWDSFRRGWVLYVAESSRQLIFSSGDGTSVSSLVGPAITMDTWSLVGVTRNDATAEVKLYVNGAQVASNTGLATLTGLSGHGIRLGAHDADTAGSDAYHFYGDLAGAVFVDSVLTGAEMLDAYTAATGEGGGGGLTVAVTSLAAEGETPLVDAVTLSEGANVTLTQVGQDIEIATLDTVGILASIVDAKGDLIAATAADAVARLAVGSNNQVLTADSAQSTGLKWAAPAATGAALYTGSGVPASGLGASGDAYIDYTNKKIYVKQSVAGSTVSIGSVSNANGTTQTFGPELDVCSRTLAGAAAGATWQKIRARIKGGTSASTARLVLYANSGAAPGALLDYADIAIPANDPVTLREATLSAGAAATNGTYWLGVHGNSMAQYWFLNPGGGINTTYKSQTFGGSPPNPFGTPGGSFSQDTRVEADAVSSSSISWVLVGTLT